ncbi:MAG TPA: PIN domain-containing protein [Candidatus Binataceae bacterium]|nr:PIN domain-containing protein [Candidatus Binataceae bacterium]
MATLIDSSVLIAAERGDLDLDSWLKDHPDDQLAIAAITASELLQGLHRARTDQQRARRGRFVAEVLERFPTVPFDLAVARVHAVLVAETDRRGRQVGAHDALIAATALANGMQVATRDLRSFPRIPGLSVIRL